MKDIWYKGFEVPSEHSGAKLLPSPYQATTEILQNGNTTQISQQNT